METLDKTVFLVRLGDNIKKIRQEKNINQAELARRCEKDRQAIERIENGKVNPTAYSLYQIAEGLEVNLNRLTDFE